jgi:competence protein ComGC
MTQQPRVTKGRGRAEEAGYTLVAVIFILFVMTIWLGVAMPKVIKQLQRDQELETQERGKQYIRAIQLYHNKFRAFPTNIDALVKTNNIRYLRKKYKDPTTGKDEWKIIRYGQAKTQTLGFFGKPLMGGSAFGGIGPVGGQNNNLFGGNPTGSGQQGQTDSSGSTGTGTGTDQSNQSSTGQNYNPSSGSGAYAQQQQSSYGQSGQNGQNGQSSSGLTGQSFGGGGIIGFSPNSPKATMITYRKRNKYNEWEFIYDPALEQYYASGAGAGAGQTNQQGYGFNPMGVGSNFGNNTSGGPGWGNSNNGSTDQNGNGSGTGQTGNGGGSGSGQSGSNIFQ